MIDMLPPSIKDVDPPTLKIGIPRLAPARSRKRPADTQLGSPKAKRKYAKIIEDMVYPNEWVKIIEEYYYAQVGGDPQRMAPYKRIIQPDVITVILIILFPFCYTFINCYYINNFFFIIVYTVQYQFP